MIWRILVLVLTLSRHATADLISDLERASDLYERGLLTPEEFARTKRHLLDRPNGELSAASLDTSHRFFGVGLPDFDIDPGQEVELFMHRVSGSAGATLTQFQLYGAGDPDAACFAKSWCLEETGFNDTRVRFYVDGERVASVDYLLYLAHGIGATAAPRHGRPWGTRRWGSGIGDKPAVYNTIRVPFTHSLRITAQLPARVTRTQRYWVDLWGVEGVPISIGGGALLLPPTEWRLRVTKNEGLRPAPQEYFTVAASRPGVRDGLLYFLAVTTLAHNCTDDACAFGYFEGCWLWGNASSTPQTARLLTSGGEEMFLGTAYFYNESFGATADVVVTEHRRYDGARPNSYNPAKPSPMTAAAVFDERPLTFGGEGGRLFWQNGAWQDERPNSTTKGLKCYARTASEATPVGTRTPSRYGGTNNVEISTYAFTYERIGP